MAITPSVNLVKYIGNVDNATHGLSDMRTLPKRIQKMFHNISKTYPLQRPMKHPDCMMRNIACEEQHWKLWGSGRWRRILDKAESKAKRIWYEAWEKGKHV